ncbi:MAG: hypothetical protein QOH93_3299, partial [Chloroflexia bacterium]|nr:hypothetical protein [Chloroflexia bacterium]
EIIGYFLTELVPKGLTPEETARRIKDQGGIVGIPHPFDTMRSASRLQTPALERLVEQGLVDIIEVFNARSVRQGDNDRALAFAREHDLAMSAGSDAHTLVEIGRAYVEIAPFGTAEQFLANLRACNVAGQLSSRLIHLGSTWARVAKSIPVVGSKWRK